jgi:hypothetical protein
MATQVAVLDDCQDRWFSMCSSIRLCALSAFESTCAHLAALSSECRLRALVSPLS